MDKKKKILIIGGIIVVAGVIIYFATRKKTSGGGLFKKSWKFEDNYWTSTGQSSSNLGFIGVTQPPFSVGDKIIVTQDGGAAFPEYDGETTVEHIYQQNGKWVMDVARKRLGDSPANPGIITSA